MADIRVISATSIQARSHINNGDSPKQIELNPWDLQFLLIESGQKGLLFHKPTTSSSSSSEHTETLIQHLKNSLSSTLDSFQPLAGRLAVVSHGGNNDTSSVFISCNNAGVSFVHAIAENTTIADILEPTYVPPIVQSFFPLSGYKNFEGTRIPLMAVQFTELVDGIFIACSINHCLADVRSFWHFLNSWAEITRNGSNHRLSNSKYPSFKRWFPDGIIERPIRIPFRTIKDNYYNGLIKSIHLLPFSKRIFHFEREKIAELKAKANSEVGVINIITSLQAVIGHVWRSVIRNQHFDSEEEVTYRFSIDARPKISHPPIPDNYFGSALQLASVTMKVGDLLGDGGLGKFSWEMNKIVSLHKEEKFMRDFESWARNPRIYVQSDRTGKVMATGSTPKINFYGIDFGWGRPVTVRCGPTNIKTWELSADAGAKEGSFDIELCISYEILEAIGRDPEFMHAVAPQQPQTGLSNKLALARL